MNVISLQRAVSEIKQVCGGDAGQFVFVVGAGISYPSVPLAAQITAQCREVAQSLGRSEQPADGGLQHAYSHWMEQAYPQPKQRRDYITDLVEDKPISSANLRLAHLLLTKQVARLVVTPNFDDFLHRALALFGQDSIVHDHPRTAERIDLDRDELQIIHVHGTYRFYDCCNLAHEVAAIAAPDPDPASMSAKLDQVFRDRGVIVVGYSGWENDVIARALSRRLHTSPPYNLYWFCHKRRELGQPVQKKLGDCSHVWFVVPPEPEREAGPPEPERKRDSGPSAEGPEHHLQRLKVEPKTVEPAPLDSTVVFETLIRALELEQPEITRDPFRFFADQLRSRVPSDDQHDIYFLSAVSDRLVRAGDGLAEREQLFDRTLEEMRDAVRTSQYDQAIDLAAGLDLNVCQPEKIRAVAEVLRSAIKGPGLDDERRAEGYALLDGMLARCEAGFREQLLVKMLARWGGVLHRLQRWDEAIAVWDRLYELGQPVAAAALIGRAEALLGGGERDGAAAACDEAMGLMVDERAPGRVLAEAWFLKVRIVSTGGDHEGVLVEVDRAMECLDGADDPELPPLLAQLLMRKAVALSNLDREEDEIAVYEEMEERFDPSDRRLRPSLATAGSWLGWTLIGLERFEQAEAVFRRMVDRYGADTDPEVQVEASRSLNGLGWMIGQLGRTEEAIKVVERVVEQCAGSADDDLRLQAGYALHCLAACREKLGDRAGQLAALERLMDLDLSDIYLLGAAYLERAAILRETDLHADCLAVLERMIHRFTSETGEFEYIQLGDALVEKALTLDRLERTHDGAGTRVRDIEIRGHLTAGLARLGRQHQAAATEKFERILEQTDGRDGHIPAIARIVALTALKRADDALEVLALVGPGIALYPESAMLLERALKWLSEHLEEPADAGAERVLTRYCEIQKPGCGVTGN